MRRLSASGTAASESSVSTQKTSMYARKDGLRLNLLADPTDGLLLRLGKQTALREKILRRLMQRVLIPGARRNRVLDEPALVELLAVLEHV